MFKNKKIDALISNNQELQQSIKNLINENRTLQARDVLGQALGVSHSGNRDVYDIYGYPQSIQYSDVYNLVRREPMAKRIAFGVPESCWNDGFSITVNDSEVLEDEIKTLESRGFIDAMRRGHTMARMGNYSVVLMGVPGQSDFSKPLTKSMGDALKTIYFRAYSYDGIEPESYETDKNNERYGLPVIYQLSVRSYGHKEKSQEVETIDVHYTRVVAMSENKLDSNLEGIPTLETAYNTILDIRKTVGGSAEAFFRNARDKTVFEIDKEFAGSLINNKEAKDSFDEAAKNFTNGWQDHIMAVGAKANNLQTNNHSPSDAVDVSIQQITALTGIPKKILTGEGAGQLSGLEDKLSYNELIQGIQESDCEVWLNEALMILNDSGVIDLPENYEIEWPVKSALSEKDEADINNTKANTLKAITDSKTTIGGDGLDLESAFSELGLEGVEIDEPEDVEMDDMTEVAPNV